MTNGDDVERVSVPSGLLRPLPLHVREHPARSKHVRVTLVRETLVALATYRDLCPPIIAEIRRVTGAAPLVDAIGGYSRTADKAAQALGLAHRRYLARPGRRSAPAQARCEPPHRPREARARALDGVGDRRRVLYGALERSAYTASLRAVVAGLASLAPYAAWLVPSLIRYAHVRIYEHMFGPFEQREGDLFTVSDRVPPEWEAEAVLRTPGRVRSLSDRAIPKDDDWTLAYKVKAWWGVRVDGETIGEVARRWHAHLADRQHREKSARDNAVVKDCGCRSIVRKGVKEVSRLLLSPE